VSGLSTRLFVALLEADPPTRVERAAVTPYGSLSARHLPAHTDGAPRLTRLAILGPRSFNPPAILREILAGPVGARLRSLTVNDAATTFARWWATLARAGAALEELIVDQQDDALGWRPRIAISRGELTVTMRKVEPSGRALVEGRDLLASLPSEPVTGAIVVETDDQPTDGELALLEEMRGRYRRATGLRVTAIPTERR
jgi:hypothetical protein